MGKDDTEAIGNPLGSVSRGLIEREPVAETKLFFITFFPNCNQELLMLTID